MDRQTKMHVKKQGNQLDMSPVWQQRKIFQDETIYACIETDKQPDSKRKRQFAIFKDGAPIFILRMSQKETLQT